MSSCRMISMGKIWKSWTAGREKIWWFTQSQKIKSRSIFPNSMASKSLCVFSYNRFLSNKELWIGSSKSTCFKWYLLNHHQHHSSAKAAKIAHYRYVNWFFVPLPLRSRRRSGLVRSIGDKRSVYICPPFRPATAPPPSHPLHSLTIPFPQGPLSHPRICTLYSTNRTSSFSLPVSITEPIYFANIWKRFSQFVHFSGSMMIQDTEFYIDCSLQWLSFIH